MNDQSEIYYSLSVVTGSKKGVKLYLSNGGLSFESSEVGKEFKAVITKSYYKDGFNTTEVFAEPEYDLVLRLISGEIKSGDRVTPVLKSDGTLLWNDGRLVCTFTSYRKRS